MNSISQNIKIYRKQNNLTQQQLAGRLGVTHQTISNWESGRSMPNIDTLKNISEKLDIDINFLLYGKRDSTEIIDSIKRYLALFVFAFLFGTVTFIYMKYRLATDVNIRIQSTIDLRYILPGGIYVSLIKPWLYILPVSIGFSFLKFKGIINDRAENKIHIFFRRILIFLLIYNTVVFWLVCVYDISALLYCIPDSIRVWIGNSTVFLLGNPGLFSLVALVYEIFRPFKNEKTFIPSDSPGRNNIIAKNIKKIRIERGLSQQQFADALFITRQTLSNWENGKSMPDISKLLQICATGGINLNDLFYISNKNDRKANLSLLFTGLLITLAVAVIVAYEFMWFLAVDLHYHSQWIPYSFPILKTLKNVISYPLLWYAVPVFAIQFMKLSGRINKIKGFKYWKVLFCISMLLLFFTAYTYLPAMVKTDIREAIQISHPIRWINYPDFSWLEPLPYPVYSGLLYIAANMKWLYAVIGIITELSKPYGESEKK